MKDALKSLLQQLGATVVGVASIEDYVNGDIGHLTRAVSIGLDGNLREHTLDKLNSLQKKAARHLKRKGYRYLCIPPDSDRITDRFVSKLYPLVTHKMAATCAGIGWIGRNGLLISPRYGPRLSLATVLTDAPLPPDAPMARSLCGDCRLCEEHCPSGAITGESWSRDEPYPDLIETALCRSHKAERRAVAGRPNCGLCLAICPHGRMQRSRQPECVKSIV